MTAARARSATEESLDGQQALTIEPVIWIIEDDEGVGKSLVRALKIHGNEVKWLRTSAETRDAILEAQRARLRPMGAVIDVRLPDGNGLSLMENMRFIWEKLPIIVCSGMRTKAITDQVAHRRALYMEKPFTPDVLIAFALGARDAAGFDVDPKALAERAKPLLGAFTAENGPASGVGRIIPVSEMRADPILIFDPRAGIRETIVRMLRDVAPAVEVSDAREALGVIAAKPMSALIVGIGATAAHDDSSDLVPWAVVDAFQMTYPLRRMLVVTRTRTRALEERAAEQGAVCFELPLSEGALVKWANDATHVGDGAGAKIRAFVEAAIRTHGLKKAQARVLHAGMLRLPPGQLVDRTLTYEGWKSQARAVKQKFGYEDENWDRLIADLLFKIVR